MNNIDKMILRDDEDFCDVCHNYRNCIEWFNGEYYIHICYKCIDGIKPKEISLYSNTKNPFKEELEVEVDK